jgi:hypothetical protein
MMASISSDGVLSGWLILRVVKKVAHSTAYTAYIIELHIHLVIHNSVVHSTWLIAVSAESK